MKNSRIVITAHVDTAYGPVNKQAVIPGYNTLDTGKETLRGMLYNTFRVLEKAVMEHYERLEHANKLEV